MVSTIRVVGFPQDATMRERKNYVCFLPGFEKSVLTKTNTLFVKFEDADLAEGACDILNTRPYDSDDPQVAPVQAEMAKNDMAEKCHQPSSVGQGQQQLQLLPQQWAAPPPQHWGAPPPPNYSHPAAVSRPVAVRHVTRPHYSVPPATPGPRAGAGVVVAPPRGPGVHSYAENEPKRARHAETPDEIFTIAVLGIGAKGLTEADVSDAFSIAPGFIGSRFITQLDAVFGKFDCPESASAAVETLSADGIPAEMARRNATW